MNQPLLAGALVVCTTLCVGCPRSDPTPPTTDDAGIEDAGFLYDAGGGMDAGSDGGVADAGAPPEDLAVVLSPIRAARSVPALGAAVVREGRVVALGAVGVRKVGDATPVTAGDLWHLGSNTKAMTSAVAATLVDEGVLSWSTTIGDVFGELGSAMDPAWASVTLEQLLAHRAGMHANPPADLWSAMWQRNAENPSTVRAFVVNELLKRPPGATVGAFMYSNAGYMTAGRMIEKRAAGEWEQVIRERLFQPLGMEACGFGMPGTVGSVNQPWGHQGNGATLSPVQGDNPSSLGPAGTVYCSLEDWAKFAAMQLDGARGEPTLISAAEFVKMHTPVSGGDYALGWIVDDGAPVQVWHNGSNTMWYAELWVIPTRDVAILVTTNCASSACQQTVTDAVDALRQRWAP